MFSQIDIQKQKAVHKSYKTLNRIHMKGYCHNKNIILLVTVSHDLIPTQNGNLILIVLFCTY